MRKVDSEAARPEAPHDGAVIYRTDLNAVEVYDDAEQQWLSSGAPQQQLAVVGEVKMWLAGSIPEGYLMLDGSEVERGIYPALFALWGTTFGVGDSTLTFNLPDMRSRLPIGAGTFAALATADALTETARTLQHSHGAGTLAAASAGAHTHDAGTLSAGLSSDRLAGALGRATQTITGNTGSNGAHTHTVNGTTAISGAAALPYFAVNFIVKH